MNNIRKYRKEKNISIQKLASKTGLSTGYICNLESGRRSNPSKKIMEIISDNLEQQVTEVFFSDDCCNEEG